MDERQEQHRKWRLNREVSAGDMVAIVVALVSVLASYFSLDKRVAVVETLSAQNHLTLKQDVNDIKQDVRRLGDKFDQMLSRVAK